MVFRNICVVNSFITTFVFPETYLKGGKAGILIHLELKQFEVELKVTLLMVQTTTVQNLSNLRWKVSNLTSNLFIACLASSITLLNAFGRYISAFHFRSPTASKSMSPPNQSIHKVDVINHHPIYTCYLSWILFSKPISLYSSTCILFISVNYFFLHQVFMVFKHVHTYLPQPSCTDIILSNFSHKSASFC